MLPQYVIFTFFFYLVIALPTLRKQNLLHLISFYRFYTKTFFSVLLNFKLLLFQLSTITYHSFLMFKAIGKRITENFSPRRVRKSCRNSWKSDIYKESNQEKKQRTNTKNTVKKIDGANFTRSNREKPLLTLQYWKINKLIASFFFTFLSNNIIFAVCTMCR